MTAESLRALAQSETGTLPPLLLALWHDAQGDWEAAHHIAQDVDSRDGAWVHAYLHRREGDDWNAAYWYRQACQPVTRGPFEAEWNRIVQTLLAQG